MKKLAFLVVAAVFGTATPALAEMPIFSAQCPQGNYIDADRNGTVHVNGAVASVREFNPNYYEATLGRVTYTISQNPDGSDLQIGYNPRGSAGGYCTIRSSAQRPSGDVVEVTGVAANDVLNVRSGPGTGYRVVGALGNGDRVRNLGCQSEGRSRWCEIEMMTDMRERGWVNSRYLTGGTASNLPSRPPQASPPSTTSTERVRFNPGTTSAQINGGLTPGSSARYVLGARNGQFLNVRVDAYGPGISYQIFNPDGSFLLDQIASDRPYGGQLWQSGDHVIEVINRGNSNTSYRVFFGID